MHMTVVSFNVYHDVSTTMYVCCRYGGDSDVIVLLDSEASVAISDSDDSDVIINTDSKRMSIDADKRSSTQHLSQQLK